jgi:hypothetical protein
MISEFKTSVPVLCSLWLASLAAADTVTLAGGNSRLTGEVRSIDGDGHVELVSGLAAEPLLLKSATVDRIAFDQQAPAGEAPTTLVELTNGDVIPAAVESFDGVRLTAVSPDAGRLVIPRESLHSLQTGVHRRKLIWQGNGEADDWNITGGERKNFSVTGNGLVFEGSATAAKKLDLTPRFIMRFTLVWEGGKVPNFKVFFADPLDGGNEAVNRYYLQFASAGLEIKRESARGRRYNTLFLLNRNHTEFPDNRLEVELRVNRHTSRIELFLNGEPEGEIADPIPGVPEGSGIAFECGHREGSAQEIRGIAVLENEDSRTRHRAEDRGDTDSDSLITLDDDRWTGSLGAIRQVGNERVYVFKASGQEEFMEIPESEVSTVFMSGGDAKAASGSHPFVLRLHPHGSLAAASCVMDANGVSVEHPLLGPLALRKDRITAIERVQTKVPEKP